MLPGAADGELLYSDPDPMSQVDPDASPNTQRKQAASVSLFNGWTSLFSAKLQGHVPIHSPGPGSGAPIGGPSAGHLRGHSDLSGGVHSDFVNDNDL